MAQNLFTILTVVNATTPLYLELGFKPGRVVLECAAKAGTAVAWRSVWTFGMLNGAAMVVTTATTAYNATNGITLLNYAPGEQALYGPVVLGFTNAAPGVLTVDSTQGITAGCLIRVTGLADNQTGTGTLNGLYNVASVTDTTVTLVESTIGKAVYVSGGFVFLVKNANATTPNPPNSVYSRAPFVYNKSIQGLKVGTACLASLAASDVLCVSAWDLNSGGL